jgi:hypothetical protein
MTDTCLAISFGGIDYTCMDCLREQGSTARVCSDCNEQSDEDHKAKHSFQVTVYEKRLYDVDDLYEQCRKALWCIECAASFNRKIPSNCSPFSLMPISLRSTVSTY